MGRRSDTRRIRKVFIASPSDVLAEREIAFKVIDDVSHILKLVGKRYQLEVFAWERVHPDAGNPQAVIQKQIPIEECDLFIGILWMRFGTPPGATRPSDGRPYLSGTEQEIDAAFEARRTSTDGRPVIMLYRKIDPPPQNMTDESRIQYARVIEYLRQFEPGGEHPALIFHFEGAKFESLLRDHLLEANTALEKDDQTKASPVGASSSIDRTDTDRADKHPWFAQAGLKDNPFQHHVAEFERDTLPGYYVPIIPRSMHAWLQEEKPYVVFSAHGHGKTALRFMIASHCYPATAESSILCIEHGLEGLSRALELAQGTVTDVTIAHQVHVMVRSALGPLQAYLPAEADLRSADNNRQRAPSGTGDMLALYERGLERLLDWVKRSGLDLSDVLVFEQRLRENISRTRRYGESDAQIASRAEITDGLNKIALTVTGMGFLALSEAASPFDSARQELAELEKVAALGAAELARPETGSRARRWMQKLVSLARATGFRKVVCLVDEIDELPGVQEHPEKMIQLLAALMSLQVREVPGTAFRYFIPAYLRPLMLERSRVFRLDRCQVETMVWQKENLRQLVQQRMVSFSKDQRAPYRALGQLCVSDGDLAERIDQEIVALCEGSPRAVIWLASRLLRIHCETAAPPRLIQPETWERVKIDWHLQGREQILGSPTDGEWLRLGGDHVYFGARDVPITTRSYRLLRRLLQAGGEGCSSMDLIRAGWPGEDPSGVTDKALREAIRRLRNELDEQGIDRDWVKSVRGRGYRIERPKDDDGA